VQYLGLEKKGRSKMDNTNKNTRLNAVIEFKELVLVINQAVDNFIEKHSMYFSNSSRLEESITVRLADGAILSLAEERLKQRGYKLEVVPDGEKSALYTIVQARG